MTEGFAAAVDGLLTAWGALDGQLAFVEGKQAVMEVGRCIYRGIDVCIYIHIYIHIYQPPTVITQTNQKTKQRQLADLETAVATRLDTKGDVALEAADRERVSLYVNICT
jgi:hypothetical protein